MTKDDLIQILVNLAIGMDKNYDDFVIRNELIKEAINPKEHHYDVVTKMITFRVNDESNRIRFLGNSCAKFNGSEVESYYSLDKILYGYLANLDYEHLKMIYFKII